MSDRTMRLAVVPSEGEPQLELRDVAIPEPGLGCVRIGFRSTRAPARSTRSGRKAILGIGGLGHLGIAFAAKMGFRMVLS